MAGAPEASRDSVGFIGLGALGAPMAVNLLRAGHPLTVHNRTPERQGPLLAAGAQAASTPALAVANAELVLVCVSDDTALRAVLVEQPNAAIHGLKPGSLVVDCSTVSPSTSIELEIGRAHV